MIKYMVMTLFLGLSVLSAANTPDIEKLKAEKEALELKLEAYTLKKKIIEMEKFLEQEKLEKKAKIERQKALIKLKHDLKNHKKRTTVALNYAG